MIVEGKGHPYVFFSILEEGSRIFAHKDFQIGFPGPRLSCAETGETLLGTLIESFPEYVRTSSRLAALLSCFSVR